MKMYRNHDGNIKAIFPFSMARSVVLMLAVAVVSLKPACADVLASYGVSADYVTADTSFSRLAARTGTAALYTFTNAFSDTVVLSPTTGYTGPAFYGGYVYTITNDPNTPTTPEPARQQIRNDVGGAGKPDLIVFQDSGYRPGGTTDYWTGATFSFQAVIVFKLSGPASLSSMTAQVSNANSGGNLNWQNGATWRWVVQSGGNYYVSQSTFTSLSTTTLNSLSNPSSELWAAYNPSLSMDFNQDSATYATLDLSHVTAAGLYLENDSWAGDIYQNSMNAAIQSLTVNGVAVPEPSSVALLTLGTALLLGLRKRSSEFSTKSPVRR